MKKWPKKSVLWLLSGVALIVAIPAILSGCGVPFCVAGIGQCDVVGGSTAGGGTGVGFQITQNPNFGQYMPHSTSAAQTQVTLSAVNGQPPYTWYCPTVSGSSGTTTASAQLPSGCSSNPCNTCGTMTVTDTSQGSTVLFTSPVNQAPGTPNPISVEINVQDSKSQSTSITFNIQN